MVSAKGKEKVTDYGGKGKRKLRPGEGGGDDDKTGRKRKNRGVLQFIEDAAYQVDEDEDSSDDSSLGSGFSEEEELESEFRVNNEPGKVSQLPYVKEEEMSEEEYDRFFEQRYKPGAGFVRYAEDGHDNKNSMDSDIYVMSDKDPKIWKVKCMIGRERYSALCLMQKYADLAYLGNKLQIISACALDHVRGFIVIEADKQNDIYEACKGLSTIYSSKVTAVPDNEISRLLSVRSKSSAISEGMWARVKNGRYKGDLAQVVAVNDVKKKVTVRLIPRIDLKSMAQKFGGGIPAKRTDIPAQRLITSSELAEFRPLIQIRRDRDTNLTFEVLDGMMLKDGCLYKKLSMDSLIFWGVIPTEDELLKFEPAKKDESTDVQWLTQLFGEKKKKEDERIKPKLGSKGGKGGGKSEGSSSTNPGHNFEMHDLVFIGRKDFGVVIGTGKDDSVQVIREGSEGPLIVDVKPSELKMASFDRKLFTVLDQHSNTLTINDDVRVLDGPLKGRQGIIKKIYKGILFLYDESEQENNGYICIKAQLCEKVNVSGNDPSEKDTEPVVSGFADLTSSPKSSLSPDKSLQDMDTKSKFSRDDNEMFSVGQSLRIRVGPLKGYICRVLAVRRSDVTVKLDSKHKIITVKSDHLSEVHGRNPAIGQGEDSGSAKPFDFLGGQESSRDWMDGAALSAEDNTWNPGGSSERTSWSAVPSDVSSPKQSGFDHADDDSKKEDSSWQVKQTPDQSSSWGAAAANSGWGKLAEPQLGGSRESLQDDSWGKAAEQWNSGGDTSASKAAWGQSGVLTGKQIDGDLNQPETNAWQKGSAGSSLVMESENRTWGGSSNAHAVTDNNQTDSWNKPTSVGADKDNKSSWGRSEGTTSWNKQDCGSSLDKKDNESSWSKDGGGWASNKLSGESSWGKSVGQSSWGQQSGVNAEDKTKGWGDQSKKSEGSGGDQGFGGWKKGGVGNRDDTRHDGSWARSNTFDSGRGSGGRGRGGRGRGRSYDQGQSGSWNKEGQFGGSSDAGKPTSWSSDQSGGWGKPLSNEGSKDKDVGSGWNLGSTANKDGEKGQGWGGAVPSTDNKPSGWNDSSGWGSSSNANDEAEKGKGWGGAMPSSDNKPSGWNDSSGWGKPSNPNEESAAAGSGVSSWDKIQKPDENKSSWNAATTSVEGNQSSGWGKEGSWGNQKALEENSGWNKSSVGNGKDNFSNSWTDTKKNEGSSTGWKKNEGSSTGWGKSNWSKSGTSEGDGNQDNSTWSSKSNWNSGGGFGDNNNQDGGRGGGWRGRGGRGDRGGGGFRGRGGSDGGGFGGRGGSGRGRFGGRGEYGGRGGSDREGGFRGRGGGFRGRGRGDWNNREDNNSNQDKSSSWGKGSNGDGEGWKSSSGYGNSWKARDNENGSSSSWNQSKGSGSSWNQGDAAAAGGGSSWGAPPAKSWNNSETGVAARDEGPASDSWGKAATGSSWGAPPANKNSEAGGDDDSWGKAAAGSSWGAPPPPADGKPSEKEEGASWGGKAATSSWGGSGSGKGGGW